MRYECHIDGLREQGVGGGEGRGGREGGVGWFHSCHSENKAF